MVDVQGIYERFCSTPLRLRAKTAASPSQSSSNANALPSSDSTIAVVDFLVRSPARERPTRREVDQLEQRIEVECSLDENASASTQSTCSRRSSRSRAPPSSATRKTTARHTKATGKKKRTTRAVSLENVNTGGTFVDTPTKGLVPPKRSRKTDDTNKTTDPEDDADKENVTVDDVCVARNIMDDFADSDIEDEAVPTKQTKPKRVKTAVVPARKPTKPVEPVRKGVRRSRRLRTREEHIAGQELAKAVQVADPEAVAAVFETIVSPVERLVNVENDCCKPLLDSKTTSGVVFALWFSAIGHELTNLEGDTIEIVESIKLLHTACTYLSHCEKLARKHSGCEDEALPATPARKRVQFRHFNLSSLDLRYIEDESAARLVEDLLQKYREFVSHVVSLWERYQLYKQSKCIPNMIAIICDEEKLQACSHAYEATRTAMESMSSTSLAEVRLCQRMLSSEFDKLSQSRVTAPPLLDSVFSPLLSSLMRYRLRFLFLPFEQSELVREDQSTKVAKYEHQDFGAAMHRALRDIHTYRDVVAPMLAVITSKKCTDREQEAAVKELVQEIEEDDRVHVEQYILACRFVRLSWSQCILQDIEGDEETLVIKEQIEMLGRLAKSCQFEDEAHLFPLASIDTLVEHLDQLEPAFSVLEGVLASVEMPHYTAEAPCVECNEIVTRDQQSESITCTSCEGRFHLRCLHLPASFAQFAGQYTCPFCYVGKKR